MNSSASKVGEIFTAAGTAFSALGELTMQLHPSNESAVGSKWTEEEIEMLQSCIRQFGDDLNKISERIKTRTVSQIRSAIKKKAYEEAGVNLPPPPVQTPTSLPNTTAKGSGSPLQGFPIPTTHKKATIPTSSLSSLKSSEVTLNMLNAPADGDSEIGPSSLNFDSNTLTSP